MATANRRVRSSRLLLAAAATALLWMSYGCGRASVTTEVRPDGTWVRKMEFHGPGPQKPNQMTMGPKIDEIFGFPSGGGWVVTRKVVKDETVVTAERTFRPGETSEPGTFLKGKGASAQVADLVTVRNAGPGRWEYRETLRWLGERPKDIHTDELDSTIRGALPPELVASTTAADVESVSHVLLEEMWRIIFGPSSPLLPQLLLHPDLAERLMAQRAGRAIVQVLERHYGARMSPQVRVESARRMIRAVSAKMESSQKAKTSAGPTQEDSGGAALVPLTFSVRLPGHIVSSNGETDELNGDVYWAMYGVAPALSDITMTATCEVR